MSKACLKEVLICLLHVELVCNPLFILSSQTTFTCLYSYILDVNNVESLCNLCIYSDVLATVILFILMGANGVVHFHKVYVQRLIHFYLHVSVLKHWLGCLSFSYTVQIPALSLNCCNQSMFCLAVFYWNIANDLLNENALCTVW